MKHTNGLLLILLATATLAACSQIETLTPQGNTVEYIEVAEVIKDKLDDASRCTIKAQLVIKSQAAFFGRDVEQLALEKEDRINRARNAAAKNDANIVVPTSDVIDRQQEFVAYKCDW